ncbi:neuralized E3 ubiquitin protein ligase 1B [Ictidomys tridecemlineatus]|nr:neuralized E3 ubiquitin protein ligase 1B [Ictidomys tridecemlineatus]
MSRGLPGQQREGRNITLKGAWEQLEARSCSQTGDSTMFHPPALPGHRLRASGPGHCEAGVPQAQRGLADLVQQLISRQLPGSPGGEADPSPPARMLATRPCCGPGPERRAVLGEAPRFHAQAKGKNVRLDGHSRRATRRNSFCNGVTFTQRPIRLYEQVRLRLVAVRPGWSGALRFGFTAHDPSLMSVQDIPKYACPDLVTRPGYWAKALPENLALRDTVLAYWADRHGRVFYSVNDGEPVLFHCGVAVGGPLWALIDVYGITDEVQLLESAFADTLTPARLGQARFSACLPPSSHDAANFDNNELENSQVVAKLGHLALGRAPGTLQSSPATMTPSGSFSGSQDDSDSDVTFSVNQSSSSESSLVTAPSSPLSPPVSPGLSPPEPAGSRNGECTVCFDGEVDTVIYTCGHMCLCHGCGLRLKRQPRACCPICRRPIKDVIKIYRP